MNTNQLSRRLSRAAFGVALALPLATSLAWPSGASAQGAPAPSAPPGPAAAAPAAPPVPVTPELRAAIKDVLDITNVREGLTRAYAAIAQGLAPQMGQVMNRDIEANTTLTADQKQRLRTNMNAPFDAAVREAQGVVTNPKLVDETIDKMYPIYAKYFTVADLKQLAAFYRSPIGTKALTALPQASAESIQAGIALFSPRVTAIIDRTMKAQFDTAAGPTAPAPTAPAKK